MNITKCSCMLINFVTSYIENICTTETWGGGESIIKRGTCTTLRPDKIEVEEMGQLQSYKKKIMLLFKFMQKALQFYLPKCFLAFILYLYLKSGFILIWYLLNMT